MDMVERFNKAQTPIVSQAKKIPTLAVDFFDQTNQIQHGFKTFETQNEPSEFTPKALDQYSTEVRDIVIPDGFVPSENGVNLNRWGPSNKYYSPGAPSTEGND